MDYDAIVIGAGNGGLTAAATLAKEGVKTLVLERHNIPGGCATSFCRGRFEFEVALHQLSGLGTKDKPGPLRAVLDRIGITDKLEFIEMTDLYRVAIPGGIDITLRPDRAEIVAELSRRFPAEKEGIAKFFDLVYKVFSEVIAIFFFKNPDPTPEKFPNFFKYALKDTQGILDACFKDPVLKAIVSAYWSYQGMPPRKLPFFDMAALLFDYIEFKPWHLKGGSMALSNALAETILANGGTIRYNCGVKRILVENGTAIGVVTDGGDEIRARFIVSNISLPVTFCDLMDEGTVPAEARARMRGNPVGTSAFTVYMGFDCEPDAIGIGESTNFIISDTDIDRCYEQSKRLEIAGDNMLLTCYNAMDKSFSPPGTCQAALVTLKYGEPWLKVPPHEYAALKYRYAESMLETAEKVHPGLRDHIEEMDIATPLTHLRYLGTPRGSIYGYDGLMRNMAFFQPNRPFVKNLYHSGAWVGMGGFEPTLTSGSTVARTIVKAMNSGGSK